MKEGVGVSEESLHMDICILDDVAFSSIENISHYNERLHLLFFIFTLRLKYFLHI